MLRIFTASSASLVQSHQHVYTFDARLPALLSVGCKLFICSKLFWAAGRLLCPQQENPRRKNQEVLFQSLPFFLSEFLKQKEGLAWFNFKFFNVWRVCYVFAPFSVCHGNGDDRCRSGPSTPTRSLTIEVHAEKGEVCACLSLVCCLSMALAPRLLRFRVRPAFCSSWRSTRQGHYGLRPIHPCVSIMDGWMFK